MAGKNFTGWIEIHDAGKKMFVVTKENNSLYIVDLGTKKIVQQQFTWEPKLTLSIVPG